MRIAIDAMGGDLAPEQIVLGGIAAADQYPDTELTLVGDEARIRPLLDEHGGVSKVQVKHASQVVEMHESARVAIRERRDSSILRAVELVAKGEADAVISAGNTAAAVALSTLKMRTLPGVHRPGIAITFPTLGSCCIVIDAGANIKPKPEHLLQYGVMASVLGEIMWDMKSPRVGLLNVGEEDAKGTALVRETYGLFSKATFNFIGNVEGNQVYEGDCDVLVCDGFAGNVILKTSEGLAECMLRMIKAYMMERLRTRIGAWLCKPAFRKVLARIDFSEYGGEPLLGVNGISMISHGRSNAKAVVNAVRQAKKVHDSRLNDHMLEQLEAQQACPEPQATGLEP